MTTRSELAAARLAFAALALAIPFSCSIDPDLPYPCTACGGESTAGASDQGGAAGGQPATTRSDGGVAGSDESGGDEGGSAAGPLPITTADLLVPGTQHGDVVAAAFLDASSECSMCHGEGASVGPYESWRGTLMAHSARDPVFFASLTVENQVAPGVGSFCLRCHAPFSVVTGTSADPTGKSLTAREQEGVKCHLCHTLVDPIYDEKTAVPGDDRVLAALDSPPKAYGNGMFVLDTTATRRGPFTPERAAHPAYESPFVRRGDFCGTCHDAGNVLTTKAPDGTYQYGRFDAPAESSDPRQQFPLLRTYTEWKLSSFAQSGVDMQGRFAGDGFDLEEAVNEGGAGSGGASGGAGGASGGEVPGLELIRTCQDCHMPQRSGNACKLVGPRPAVPTHELVGSSASVLDMIIASQKSDPNFDATPLQTSRKAAIAMLQHAVTLETKQRGSSLDVRVYNESGHKLPTGHADSRRVWLDVRLYQGTKLVKEYGAYDASSGKLDEASTRVFEMRAALSAGAARTTGQPEGFTRYLTLADRVLKDTRIPPRGYAKAAFDAAGAGVVGADFADGQYWVDQSYAISAGATRALVIAYYQVLTAEHVEALASANDTDRRGETLRALFEATGKAPPIVMASVDVPLSP